MLRVISKHNVIFHFTPALNWNNHVSNLNNLLKFKSSRIQQHSLSITCVPILWAFRTKIFKSSDVGRTNLRQSAAMTWRLATLMAMGLVLKSHTPAVFSCSSAIFPASLHAALNIEAPLPYYSMLTLPKTKVPMSWAKTGVNGDSSSCCPCL